MEDQYKKERDNLKEKKEPTEVIVAAPPKGDVDDLIFAREPVRQTSDR